MSEDEDTEAIEELVSNRLNSWNGSAKAPSILQPGKPAKKSPRKRLRTSRANPTDASLPSESVQLKQLKTVRRNAALESVFQRALNRTIIKPRISASRKTNLPESSFAQPNVVVARDLRPDRKNRKNNTRPLQSGQGRVNAKISGTVATVDAAQFVDSHRREVSRFGSRALDKRERKSFEAAEMIRLGCRRPKNPKMPIGLLIRKREKQKVRGAKKKEMDLATGMLVRSKRK